jgi:hypothetical protein
VLEISTYVLPDVALFAKVAAANSPACIQPLFQVALALVALVPDTVVIPPTTEEVSSCLVFEPDTVTVPAVPSVT